MGLSVHTNPGELDQHRVASDVESGSYTGDGSTTGREIETTFSPAFLYIQEDGDALTLITSDNANALLLAPGLASSVQSTTEVHMSGNGFTVGDGGTEGNVSGTTYNWVAQR